MSLTNSATTATGGAAPPVGAPRILLALGSAAGPLYVTVSLVETLTREGYDPTRHAWSMLANGGLGWIHTTNLLVSGLLVVAGAMGLHRVLSTGPGSVWAPRLLGIYGLGMVAAGAFPADPGRGFPPGTPETVPASWHGILHLAVAGVGFLGLVAACFVLARRFAAGQMRAWAVFSRGTGAVFLASFVAMSGSGGSGWAILAFTAAVILASAWITLVLTHQMRRR